MLVGILIGILVWQLVGFVVLLITNDEEKVAIVGVVIPWAIFGACFMVYKKIRLTYYKKNYSLCAFYSTKDECEPMGHHGGVGIKNRDISKYYQSGENKYYIHVYRNGKDFKSAPDETITTIRKNGYFCQEWVDENFKKPLTK